jgi:DNA-binding NarL/FixJ family response regulator
MEQPHHIRLMVVGEDRVFAGRLLRVLREAEPGSLVLVGTVAKSDEACALVSRARPGVILVDIDSVGIEGVGLIGAQSQAPILALSTQRDAALCARALRAGARGIIQKTDAPETIRKALHKVSEGEIWLDRLTTSRILRDAVAAPRRVEFVNGNGNGIANLTSRERDIVIALVRYDGANGRALAARLGMSEQTLRNHFSSIYRKLGIPNRSGLVAYATRLHLDTAA